MRLIQLSCVAAVLVACPALADPVGDALTARAETCIRSEAPAVSRMTPSPNDAVTFLVSDLCAVEIQRAENYEANSRMLAQLQATMPAPALTGVSVDPATGDFKAPPGFSTPIGVQSSMLSSTLRNLQPRAKFAAFAARAVLAARSTSH